MRRAHPAPRRTAALAVLALALGACAPKRVVVGGQEMSQAEADAYGEREIARVKAETASLPPEKAGDAFLALAGQLGDARAAGDALYEAALRYRAAGRPERAVQTLGELLTRFPLARSAMPAKYELALLDVELGRPKEGLASLSTLYDKLAPEERPRAARSAADAAEAARLWREAVRWRTQAAETQGGAEREKELGRAVEIADSQLSAAEVVSLRSELPREALVQPALGMKLARIQLHVRDYAAAEALAREQLERWPDGPWAAEAREILDRLTRRAKVSPGVLGVAVPLSGRSKARGDAILAGVSQALEGSGIKVVARDTRGEAEGAAEAIEALALEEGAIAVVGAALTAEADRAAAAAQELEIPLLSLSWAEPVTAAGPFVFRVMLTAEAQARAIAELAFTRRNMRRFAVMYPNVPYGVGLANAFWDEVERRGGEIRGAEVYEHDRTSFAPLVKEMTGKRELDLRSDYLEKQREILKAEKDPFRRKKALERLRETLPPVIDFDAIFIPDFARTVALLAPALAVEDVVTSTCDPKEVERIRRSTGRPDLQPVQLFGGNGWNDPSLVEKAGKYVTCAIFVDGFYAGSERPQTRKFVEAFQARNGRAPSILEASAHDAAGLVRAALEKGKPTTRDALRQAVAATRGWPGATGDLSFDDRREPEKALFFLTIDKAGIRELKPEELAAPGAGGP